MVHAYKWRQPCKTIRRYLNKVTPSGSHFDTHAQGVDVIASRIGLRWTKKLI